MINIEITQAAREQLDKIQEPDRYLRILLSKTGCCSFSFNFFVDQKKRTDEILEAGGYKFLITEREKVLLENAVALDYGRKGIFKEFKIVMR